MKTWSEVIKRGLEEWTVSKELVKDRHCPLTVMVKKHEKISKLK